MAQSPFDGAKELQTMLVDYAKQETIEPFKNLGRYLVWGIAGGVLVFVGVFFICLGVLRLFQSFDTFQGGSWASTIPYVAALGTLLLFTGILALRFKSAANKALS